MTFLLVLKLAKYDDGAGMLLGLTWSIIKMANRVFFLFIISSSNLLLSLPIANF